MFGRWSPGTDSTILSYWHSPNLSTTVSKFPPPSHLPYLTILPPFPTPYATRPAWNILWIELHLPHFSRCPSTHLWSLSAEISERSPARYRLTSVRYFRILSHPCASLINFSCSRAALGSIMPFIRLTTAREIRCLTSSKTTGSRGPPGTANSYSSTSGCGVDGGGGTLSSLEDEEVLE